MSRWSISLVLCLALASHAAGRGRRVELIVLPADEDVDRARLDELLDLFHQMEHRQQTTPGWMAVSSQPQTPATIKVLQAMALEVKEGWKRALVLQALSSNNDASLLPFWKKLAANKALPTEEGVAVVRGLSSSRDPEGLRLARTLAAAGDNWAEAVIDGQNDELPFTQEMAAALFDDERRSPRLRARALAELRFGELGTARLARAIKEGPPEVRWAGLAFAPDVAAELKVEAIRSTSPLVRAEVAKSFAWRSTEKHSLPLCKAMIALAAEPKSPLEPWPAMLLTAGACQDRAGHLEQAVALYRRALATQRADAPTHGGPFDPTPELLMRLTRLAYLTGRAADARETLEELRQQMDVVGSPDLPNQSHLSSGDLISTLEKELDAPFRVQVTVKGRKLTLTFTNVTKDAWDLEFPEHAANPGGYPGYLEIFVDQQACGYGAQEGGPSRARVGPGQTLQFVETIKAGAPKRGRVDVVFDVAANSSAGHRFELRMQAMTVTPFVPSGVEGH